MGYAASHGPSCSAAIGLGTAYYVVFNYETITA
jgi:hypothetical protein